MPFYRYVAVDRSGRTVQGTLSAPTVDAATQALTQQGFTVRSLADPAAASPPVSAARSAAPSRPSVPQANPAARVALATPPTAVAPRSTTPSAVSPAPVAPNPAPPAPVRVKTIFGRDKDLYFLFSQLHNLFNAGVTPSQAFHDLANRSPARYATSLREIGKGTGDTATMSEVLERYPYLYPPDVVGTVRAGEVAGFLPEAMSRIADQLHSSHRLKRRLTFVLFYFCVLMATIPIAFAVVQGSLATVDAQNKVDGALPPVATLQKFVGAEIVKVLPTALASFTAAVAFLFGWHSMPMRNLRHQLALRFPILGRRIWAEAMARFSWATGMVARSGVAPQRAFELAADTVPNLVIRERLREAARSMRENERLSAAVRRADILPPEYASVIETGELTGDVPKAMDQVARAADVEFEARDRTASTGMTVILMLALGAVVCIVVAILWRMYISGVITVLTQDPA